MKVVRVRFCWFELSVWSKNS